MAYVRKTDTLVDDIRRKCDQMSRVARAQFDVDAVTFTDGQRADLIEAAHVTAWSKAPELRGKLPEEWVAKVEEATLRIYGQGTKVFRDGHVGEYPAMSRTFAADFVIPHTKDTRSYRPSIDVAYANMTPALKVIIDGVAGNSAKQAEVKEKFKTVKYQLTEFMKQHASLNTAIKEMPQLEMYVPDEYMRQIRAESAPRSKVEKRSNVADLNIDVDALTAAAITHRIATA